MSERVILSAGLCGSVTVTGTSAKILDEEYKRNFLYLANISSDPKKIVWIGLGSAAVVGEGIPLMPGGAPLNMQGSLGIYTGDIYAISASGTTSVSYQTLTSNI